MSSREPGTVLDGKYEIVERLASGGMGEVYLVRHVHLQELRVVKILRQDLAADPVAQKRFVREARLATQIKHSNVAILYDFSRLPDGSFYMVWEHIEGRDVGEVLRQRGPFPVATALRLGIQALRGLGAIHSAGIIHRDVSPDNLMIVENQRQQAWVKIIDLGLAKNLAPEDATSSGSFEITQVGMFMGKLQYCSPEQAGAASGEVLDRRTDLYSFALVLYEMVTGLPPFESESPHGFIFKRLSEEPLPMVGRNPKVQVPAELDRAIRQALERDRDRRFPDAVSFIVALEKVEKGLSRVETKEVVMPAESRAATTTSAAAAPPPRQRSSSELSREERLDLLAQIERAARRVSESSLDLARVEGVIAAGRVEEGRRLLAQIEAANPRTPGLERIKERLAQAQGQGPAPPPTPAKTPEPAPAQTSAPAVPRAVAAVPRPAGAGAPPSAPPGATPAAATPPAGSPGSGISRPMARSGATPAVAAAAAAAALAGAPAPAPAAAPTPAPPAALRAAAPATPAAATAMPPAAAPPAGPDARTADQRQRTGEAEKALRRYLERKQLALARLALETLLDLAPQHPNRTDYESWVNLLAEEVEQDRRAEVALQAARAAILRRDFAKAHQELEQVRRNDLSGERAEALERELQDVEQGLRQGAEFERHRQRLDELLGARKLAEAEREIEQLAGLGLSNITLGSYRERLEEARLAAEQERLAAPIEKRYRELVHARDWFGARDAALELERAAPASPRPAAMHAEIERLESIHRHQQAVEQGVRQVEAFLEKGDLANAELALRILLQIDPENRHRKRFERQLRSGRG